MSASTNLRHRFLLSVIRVPPVSRSSPTTATSIRVRSFHSDTPQLNQGFSVSFGPQIDSLLKPRNKPSKKTTAADARGNAKRIGKNSIDNTVTKPSATNIRSRRQPTPPLTERSGDIVGRDLRIDTQQGGLVLSEDAYETISQPEGAAQDTIQLSALDDDLLVQPSSRKHPQRTQTLSGHTGLKPVVPALSKASTTNLPSRKDLEPWQIQKGALEKKFGGEGWNPRKKLSPDAVEGIRLLNEQNPERYTTPILAEQFKVSPEAIRRILKSKWRPNVEKMDERRVRWARRHDRIWDQKAALGLRPPRVTDREVESPEAFEEEVRSKQMLGNL